MQKDFSIGIIGGGQLARMMYPAAVELGLRVGVLAEGPDVSAAQVFADVQVGDYTDPATVRAFAARHTAITFDHEHVPTDLLHELEDAGVAVRPGPDALVHAQDKAVMRAKLSADGFPCPVFEIVETPAQLVAFGDRVGWPIIAKTSRGGYDGKGVFTVDAAAGAAEPFGALPPGAVIVAEEFVAFRRELSALVARRREAKPSPTRSASRCRTPVSAARPPRRRRGWTPPARARSRSSRWASPPISGWSASWLWS